MVAKYLYDAWGNCTVSSETTNYTVANANPIRYRGYYYDDELGLYYLQSRYYDPMVGRFINADFVETLFFANDCVQTNMYCYCSNNSITLRDDGGMLSLDDLYKKIEKVLKKLYERFIEKIKKQLVITRKYLQIGTSFIKLALNAVMTFVVSIPVKKGIETIISLIMKRYIQNSTHSFIQFIGKLLNNGFTKWVLKVMLLSAVNLGYLGAISGYLKDIAIDTILPSWLILSKINSICSACSSIAGLLAFVLDLLDSKWDDYLTIRFV